MVVTALIVASGCRTCEALPVIDAGGGGPDVDSAPAVDATPPDAESPGDRFTTPVSPDGLLSSYNDNGPTLTDDQLEMVFVSERPSGVGMTDLWTTQRAAITERWNAPVLLGDLSSTGPEDHPWISPDGLTLLLQRPQRWPGRLRHLPLHACRADRSMGCAGRGLRALDRR